MIWSSAGFKAWMSGAERERDGGVLSRQTLVLSFLRRVAGGHGCWPAISQRRGEGRSGISQEVWVGKGGQGRCCSGRLQNSHSSAITTLATFRWTGMVWQLSGIKVYKWSCKRQRNSPIKSLFIRRHMDGISMWRLWAYEALSSEKVEWGANDDKWALAAGSGNFWGSCEKKPWRIWIFPSCISLEPKRLLESMSLFFKWLFYYLVVHWN